MAMESSTSPGVTPLVLKFLFFLLTLLVLAAVGYSAWIVVVHWDLVGV
jgi:hypothetical protein